jgi:hypothetical protein
MPQTSPGMQTATMTRRDADEASVHSFDTILPSYSEATLPSYTPRAPTTATPRYIPESGASQPSSSRTRATSLPSVTQPQILSYSQSNLPLRFSGPSHPWAPKIVYPSNNTRRTRVGLDLNVFSRSQARSEALAHGDTSESPAARRRSSAARPSPGLSFEEEVRIRELDELTRAISRAAQTRRRDYSTIVPQEAGSLRNESRLLRQDWDNVAAEAQREEFVIRLSELEAQVEERQFFPAERRQSLLNDIKSLRAILASRRQDVSNVHTITVARLREIKENGTRVSHEEKACIKNDVLSMKAELTFLEQRTSDLGNFITLLDGDNMGTRDLGDDNWDHWFAISGHRNSR